MARAPPGPPGTSRRPRRGQGLQTQHGRPGVREHRTPRPPPRGRRRCCGLRRRPRCTDDVRLGHFPCVALPDHGHPRAVRRCRHAPAAGLAGVQLCVATVELPRHGYGSSHEPIRCRVHVVRPHSGMRGSSPPVARRPEASHAAALRAERHRQGRAPVPVDALMAGTAQAAALSAATRNGQDLDCLGLGIVNPRASP